MLEEHGLLRAAQRFNHLRLVPVDALVDVIVGIDLSLDVLKIRTENMVSSAENLSTVKGSNIVVSHHSYHKKWMRQLTTSEPKISSDCVTKTFLEGHHSVLQTNLPEGRKVYIFWNILKVLWLKRFELLSFCRLGRPTPSRSKSPSNISLHINAGPPLHYTRSEWQQEFLILCWYKVLMHCSVTQKCSVYGCVYVYRTKFNIMMKQDFVRLCS